MIKDISKTIFFRFTNKFTKQPILTIEMPWLPFKATSGYYSRMFKKIKEASAFSFDKNLISGKYWFETKKIKRTIIKFNEGMAIDMPYDVTEKDIKIILHHLEGLKMAVAK